MRKLTILLITLFSVAIACDGDEEAAHKTYDAYEISTTTTPTTEPSYHEDPPTIDPSMTRYQIDALMYQCVTEGYASVGSLGLYCLPDGEGGYNLHFR